MHFCFVPVPVPKSFVLLWSGRHVSFAVVCTCLCRCVLPCACFKALFMYFIFLPSPRRRHTHTHICIHTYIFNMHTLTHSLLTPQERTCLSQSMLVDPPFVLPPLSTPTSPPPPSPITVRYRPWQTPRQEWSPNLQEGRTVWRLQQRAVSVWTRPRGSWEKVPCRVPSPRTTTVPRRAPWSPCRRGQEWGRWGAVSVRTPWRCGMTTWWWQKSPCLPVTRLSCPLGSKVQKRWLSLRRGAAVEVEAVVVLAGARKIPLALGGAQGRFSVISPPSLSAFSCFGGGEVLCRITCGQQNCGGVFSVVGLCFVSVAFPTLQRVWDSLCMCVHFVPLAGPYPGGWRVVSSGGATCSCNRIVVVLLSPLLPSSVRTTAAARQ